MLLEEDVDVELLSTRDGGREHLRLEPRPHQLLTHEDVVDEAGGVALERSSGGSSS